MRIRDLFERLAKTEYDYWQLDKRYRIEIGLRPDTMEDGYRVTVAIQVARDVLNEAVREVFPIKLGRWEGYFDGAPRVLESPEQVYQSVDTLLREMEAKLSDAYARLPDWAAQSR